jgi:hypothetical protein
MSTSLAKCDLTYCVLSAATWTSASAPQAEASCIPRCSPSNTLAYPTPRPYQSRQRTLPLVLTIAPAPRSQRRADL